jgi:hypothetical protein
MTKKILVLLVVLLLLAVSIQVASADPNPDPEHNTPTTGGACNMLASVWPPDPETGEDTGPGNHKGVDDEDRGMIHVHVNHDSHGAQNMSRVVTAHGPCPA